MNIENMTERERLIEILENALKKCLKHMEENNLPTIATEFIVDKIMEKGVIALPELKHKQVLYLIYNKTIKPLEISSYMIRPEFNNLLQIYLYKNGFNGCCTLDDFGKTVFLTREEAEAALCKLQANYQQVRKGESI